MSKQFAQSVCLNGHQYSSTLDWGQSGSGFCETCGAELISSCTNCNYPIAGNFDGSGDSWMDLTWISRQVPIPSYCNHCGHPYPWTQSTIESAQELIEMSDLEQSDKDKFKETIPDILTDTPKTKVAAQKFNIYVKIVGSSLGSALRDVLVDIASETAKKAIWGA